MGGSVSSHPTATAGIPAWLERSPLWRLKLRLQFTGWLQFLAPTVVGTLHLLAGAVGWILAGPSVMVRLLVGAAVVLLAVAAFDLATVKLGLHPVEALPPPRKSLDAFDLMRARRSCRSFQRRDLLPAHRTELLDVAGRETRPDRMLGRSPIRLEYVAAKLTVWPVLGAHEFLVALAPKTYDRLAVIDVGRSLQKVVLHATRMGVATCWIGPGADQKSVVAHLGDRFDPERDHVICVCALGYASRYLPLSIRLMQLGQHRRLPLSSLFFADPAFSTPLDVTTPPFSAYGRCYEVCQWSPSSYNGQTTRCAAITEAAGAHRRLVRFDFCAATASRYYAPVALGIWCANWEAGCETLGRKGHFAVLEPAQRGLPERLAPSEFPGEPSLPRHDVSWVVAPDETAPEVEVDAAQVVGAGAAKLADAHEERGGREA